MRETHTTQQSIFQSLTNHEIARELQGISDWLNAHPELLDLQVTNNLYGLVARKLSGLGLLCIVRINEIFPENQQY